MQLYAAVIILLCIACVYFLIPCIALHCCCMPVTLFIHKKMRVLRNQKLYAGRTGRLHTVFLLAVNDLAVKYFSAK